MMNFIMIDKKATAAMTVMAITSPVIMMTQIMMMMKTSLKMLKMNSLPHLQSMCIKAEHVKKLCYWYNNF